MENQSVTSKQLCDAILANNAKLVAEYLDKDKVNANMDLSSNFPSADASNGYYCEGKMPEYFNPLHLALVNVRWREKDSDVAVSLSIIRCLLKHGANRYYNYIGGGNVRIIYRYRWNEKIELGQNWTPIDLAFSLWKSRRKETLFKVTRILDGEDQAEDRSVVPTTHTYKELLLSDDFSDIDLVCNDGQTLPGHRCILAASCTYFKTAFTGPWLENKSNVWKVDHSSTAMKAVLSCLYTGTVNTDVLKNHSPDLLAAANELQVESLVFIATMSMLENIDVKNVKTYLQAAHLYGRSDLKKACFDFVRKNLTLTLTNKKVASLATDGPALWDELAAAINSPRKRARTD